MIDIWMGRLACFVLTGVRRLGDALGKGQDNTAKPVRKILFLKLIEQGATVLAYSALKRAVEMVGRENVYFCVFEENRPILDILDLVPPENVFPIRHQTFGVFLWDVWHMLKEVWHLQIDATVDMEFFARASAILAFLTGARRRVGLHRFTSEAPYRGDLLTHRVQYNPYLHTAKFYHLLVAALTADPDDLPMMKLDVRDFTEVLPVFVPEERERRRVRELLRQELPDWEKGSVVLLNPNASDMLPLRKWPTERFEELGRVILARHPDAAIVITGAPSEREAAEALSRRIGEALRQEGREGREGKHDPAYEVEETTVTPVPSLPPATDGTRGDRAGHETTVGLSPRVASLAGKTTLRELLVLYSMADVLVTNDSGPGHFASLTPIHSIVMYGPETPALFGAIGGRFDVIQPRLACSPCVNVFNHRFSPCVNNLCMQSITVEEVYAKVAAALAAKRPSAGCPGRDEIGEGG
ncbi:MAG: glycosyltransferase family 9 protein [Syntrophobacterales bacterium]|nr:glycosyltransferase family 9 protein [Syntrophobacterales bacterium]